MDRFEAMRVFTRIVECRSFTQAADELALSRSSVTDAIKGMEARLGVRLLQRTTRQVKPTLDGEAFYQRCVRIVAELEDAESAFAGMKPRGMLHVSVHGSLASHFLVPHLPKFLETYPDIRLRFSETDRYADLVREGIDCVLRVGRLQDSELVARRLGAIEQVTCAAPAYLKQHGVPRSLDELEGHNMVGFHSSATGQMLPLEFLVDDKPVERSLPCLMAVNGAETYAAAAAAGLGLIQSPRYRLAAALQQGHLVALLEQHPPPPLPVSVLYPSAKHLSRRLRAFIDWVKEAVQFA